MADYDKWLDDVKEALRSVNMPFDDWQSRWRFEFRREFESGAKADDAAMKANRFWWREQNRSLNQECRIIPNCWLPRGHQAACQPVSTPTYETGDYIKVEFSGEPGMPGEWMWVRVNRSDPEKELVYGTLDNQPLNDYEGKLKLGSQLAISYDKVREHKKASEFRAS